MPAIRRATRATTPRSASPTTPLPPPPAATGPKPLKSPGFAVDKNGIAGAYFRKVMTDSSKANVGLRATGTLPTPTFDPRRQFVSPNGMDDFKTGPLDRPSVYMGGHAGGNELDCGLTWDRVYDSQRRATYTDCANGSDGRDPAHRFVRGMDGAQQTLVDGNGKVVAKGLAEVAEKLKSLRPHFAFRPYWRTTGDGNNTWNNPGAGTPQNLYFYPGEKLVMNVQEGGPDKVRMDIRLEGSAVQQHSTQVFDQQGFGVGKARSFKRIMSVDQFRVVDGERKGNEKQPVIKTSTTLAGGRWDEVTVSRRDGTTRPMTGAGFTEVRGRDLASRYGEVFKLSGFTDRGGESLQLVPLH